MPTPYKTVKDVIAAARAQPHKLTFGSQGNGTSAHLAGEMFDEPGQGGLTHVPYRGAGPAMTDLLGGQVDMIFGTASAVAPFVQSGKLRAIAVTTDKRSAAFPNVPTIAEAGVPGYVVESWYGLFVPQGTPPAVIAQLERVGQGGGAIRCLPQAGRADEGLDVTAGSPEELDRYVRGEEARWRKVVKENNITAE